MHTPFMDRVLDRIWQLAETADWRGTRPRWFWRWLLRYLDRRNGYHLEYDDD